MGDATRATDGFVSLLMLPAVSFMHMTSLPRRLGEACSGGSRHSGSNDRYGFTNIYDNNSNSDMKRDSRYMGFSTLRGTTSQST